MAQARRAAAKHERTFAVLRKETLDDAACLLVRLPKNAP
jgi:hypothetical protein